MKARTLFAVARADWSPHKGRAFAQIGPHHVLCCEPGADISSDAKDAAELARRWNAFPILVAALERIAATRDARHAVDALSKTSKVAA
ncbi:hypothetical protein [Paraburkholderia rhynchosiae]|uniref:Uncharacterized protein n=1 Tax=Paraburkholderia rhynchosiae TaxID=487049 RepID=A0A2N7WD75_9BURK|nr:hypothetical protein [Paraburkholderia rhynchosiae]PMS27315.1 hypothetical protein C0Z16_25145 [Paraburkholderia rhynchosiae]CAB3744329.1 hypothetical protein LMG27174_07158 [Paraburkholderia rhynchosiae]